MKNQADREGCYLPRPKAEVDNTLRDLLNSSYPTKAECLPCYTAVARLTAVLRSNLVRHGSSTTFETGLSYSFPRRRS